MEERREHSEYAENLNHTEGAENAGNSENAENANNTGNPENVGNPENAGSPENAENSDGADNAEHMGNAVQPQDKPPEWQGKLWAKLLEWQGKLSAKLPVWKAKRSAKLTEWRGKLSAKLAEWREKLPGWKEKLFRWGANAGAACACWAGRAKRRLARIPQDCRALWNKLRHLRGRQRAVALCAVGVLVLGLGAVAAWRFTTPPGAIDVISVDAAYLADTGSAVLLTDGRVSLSYLRRNLKAAGLEEFTITKVTEKAFSMRFAVQPKAGESLVLNLGRPWGIGTPRKFTLRVKPPLADDALEVRLLYGGRASKMDVSGPVLLLFSADVPQEELKKSLSFSGSKISVTVVNNIAVVQILQELEYNKWYRLAVSNALEVDGRMLSGTYQAQVYTAATPEDALATGTDGAVAISESPAVKEIEQLAVKATFEKSSFTEFDPNDAITLTFSDEVDEESLRKHLVITPFIGYTLSSVTNNTFVIKPDKTLGFGMKFTVAVTAGLESKNGMRLSSRFFLNVTVRSTRLSLSLTNQESNIVDVNKPLTLEFEMNDPTADHRLVDITVFRMNNYKQYRTLLAMPEIKQEYDLLELTSTTEILRNGLNTIQVPNPGTGIYLLRTTTTDPGTNMAVTLYKCFNVTDLSVYLQVVNEQTLAWVNNTTTLAAQSGLTVELSDRTSRIVLGTGVTGADGSCEITYVVPVPKEVDNYDDGVLTVYNAAGDMIYADRTSTIEPGTQKPKRELKYYTFFFTDRTLYHPTDTIHFWGFVKPYLMNTEPMPKYVRVVFDQGGLNQTLDVPLTADGVFTGEIVIEQVPSSQYPVDVYLYDSTKEEQQQLTHLEQMWLEAKEFEKPTFVLTTETAKPVFTAPESVEVIARLSFYDGTPVPGYPLEISVMNLGAGNVQEVRTVKTDASGAARFLFKPDAAIGGTAVNLPESSYYTVTLTKDGEILRREGSYAYQFAGVVADAQIELQGSTELQLSVRANEPKTTDIDLLQLAELTSGAYGDYGEGGTGTVRLRKLYSVMAGKPAEVGMNGTVKVEYTDTRGGQRSESFPVSAMAKDGVLSQSLKLEVPCDPKHNVNAEVQIACVDDNLNLVTSQWVINTIPPAPEEQEQEEYLEEDIQGYTLSVTRNDEETPLKYSFNYMGYNDQTVDMGDVLTLQLNKDGKPVPNEGKIFYQLMQDQTLGKFTTTEDTFQLDEKLVYAQSVHLVAAYFDGRAVHPVRDTALRVDLSSVELDIGVQTDQPSYRPGDTASIQVSVKDKNGRPVAGNVCLSVVDESLFALKEQVFDITNDLYDSFAFSGLYIRKYTTELGDIEGQFTGGDGGKGGSGIEAYDIIRDNFKDTAFFYPARTDGQGNVNVSFQLPDNTTSWRITTVSVGGNLYGGVVKNNIITTLPFFSKPTVTAKYLEGDEVVVLQQGHGTLLEEDSEISYLVHLVGNGVDRVFTAAGTARNPVRISFGELESGEYQVYSTAQFAQYRDTVVLPLTVIPSNLEMVVNKQTTPLGLAQLKIARYPITLTYYDSANLPLYKSINQLLAFSGTRIDQRLARYTAKNALKGFMRQEQIPHYLQDDGGNAMINLQRADGGMRWYTMDDSSDPLLTAKVSMLGVDKFNASRMAGYLEKLVENESVVGVTKAAVYAGLCTHKPEYLEDVREILAQEDVPLNERLYYIAALALGGDTERAQALFTRDVVPYLKISGNGTYMAYSNVEQRDRAFTAQAWVIASKLQLPVADRFTMYFMEPGRSEEIAFEAMMYVANYEKSGRAMGPVLYSQGGVGRTLNLGFTGQYSEMYLKSEFQSLRFTQVPENLSVMAYFIGEPADIGRKPDDRIKLRKSIKEQADGSYLNTIQVTFAKDAPLGTYDISDWIPSNMRFFSMGWAQGGAYEQELQKMYFTIKRNSMDDLFTITYVTRKTFAADTMQDSTYIMHGDTGVYNFSERKKLLERIQPAVGENSQRGAQPLDLQRLD